jgi:transketolase
MRDAFVRSLMEIAGTDRNVMLLTGDLGFGVLNGFAREFPKQYLNVGVAEQNMTGLATGMALEGKTVFTYSIGNFPTLRCLEQIRNDVCYHKSNVKIVCIGGGFCYGAVGMSHHATEDLAIMRVLPHMLVMAPGDIVEAAWATKIVYKTQGPAYLRLGRGGGVKIHKDDYGFELGKAHAIFQDGDIALLSSGEILDNVIKVHGILKDRGILTSVYSVLSLKPFDEDLIKKLSFKSRLIVTIEEHSIIGGLGGAVAEVMAELGGRKASLMRIGLNDCFSCEVGDQEYLQRFYGLSPDAIANKIQKALVAIN